MGFFRQEYLSGLPFPFPSDLPDAGMETMSPMSPLQVDSLPLCHLGSPSDQQLLSNGSGKKKYFGDTPNFSVRL